jgi:hypothetical protein
LPLAWENEKKKKKQTEKGERVEAGRAARVENEKEKEEKWSSSRSTLDFQKLTSKINFPVHFPHRAISYRGLALRQEVFPRPSAITPPRLGETGLRARAA